VLSSSGLKHSVGISNVDGRYCYELMRYKRLRRLINVKRDGVGGFSRYNISCIIGLEEVVRYTGSIWTS